MADQLITGTTLIEDKRGEFGKIISISAASFTNEGDDAETFGPVHYNTTYTSFAASLPTPLSIDALYASIQVPNGYTVIEAIVYGQATNGTSPTWALYRQKLSSATAPQEMASGNCGTGDYSISFNKVDNSEYAYYFKFTKGNGDEQRVYGARIKYE